MNMVRSNKSCNGNLRYAKQSISILMMVDNCSVLNHFTLSSSLTYSHVAHFSFSKTNNALQAICCMCVCLYWAIFTTINLNAWNIQIYKNVKGKTLVRKSIDSKSNATNSDWTIIHAIQLWWFVSFRFVMFFFLSFFNRLAIM